MPTTSSDPRTYSDSVRTSDQGQGYCLEDRLGWIEHAIAQAAPMRTYPAGALLHAPHTQIEALFIPKRGRGAPTARALAHEIRTGGQQ